MSRNIHNLPPVHDTNGTQPTGQQHGPAVDFVAAVEQGDCAGNLGKSTTASQGGADTQDRVSHTEIHAVLDIVGQSATDSGKDDDSERMNIAEVVHDSDSVPALPVSVVRRAVSAYDAVALLRGNACSVLNAYGLIMGDAGAQQIATVLAENTSVTELNLSCNRIGSEGAKSLADALARNTSLRSLNLRGNNLRADGGGYLADALERNDSLTSLNLAGNGLGTVGASRLAASLRRNEAVSALTLSGNGVSPAGVDQLVEAIGDSAIQVLEINGLNVGSTEEERNELTRITAAIERKRPCMILTLSRTSTGQIACMSLAGNELTNRSPNDTIPKLLQALSAQTGIRETQLRLMREDGVFLCDIDGTLTLDEVLSCEASELLKHRSNNTRFDRSCDSGRQTELQRNAQPADSQDTMPRPLPQKGQGDLSNSQPVTASRPQELVSAGLLGCIKTSLSHTRPSDLSQNSQPRKSQYTLLSNTNGLVVRGPQQISSGGFLGCIKSSMPVSWQQFWEL